MLTFPRQQQYCRQRKPQPGSSSLCTPPLSPPCGCSYRAAHTSDRRCYTPDLMATPGRTPPVPAHLELKAPPYPLNALEPYMSQQTLEFHWGKHHRGYVDGLKKQIAGTELDGLPLENVIVKSYNDGDPLPTFNNAAQIWNHDFFWGSMKPGGGGQPSGTLLELIERDFGSVQALLDQFKNAALTQFGSGWAWLVYKPRENDYTLAVEKTPNAVNPLVWEYTRPLLVVDVWEHAYYLDYQNRRADFVSTFVDKLISWEAVSSRLDAAIAQAAESAGGDEKERAGGRVRATF